MLVEMLGADIFGDGGIEDFAGVRIVVDGDANPVTNPGGGDVFREVGEQVEAGGPMAGTG